MLYLNQAGTSWPKPATVHTAVGAIAAADPTTWPDRFRAAHERVAAALDVSDSSRLLLTPGCTSALQIALSDLPWAAGDRLLMSGLEHHALVRPATLLEKRGVLVEIVPPTHDAPVDLQRLDAELERGSVRLVAMTAACNVTGEILPIQEIVTRAHAHGALCLIDGAQVVGWQDVSLTALGADLFAFAAHKGLQAPWGLGGLYVAPHVEMHTPAAACEVSVDAPAAPCVPMPGYCDAGSVNLSALAGLAAALDWLAEPAQEARLPHARAGIESIVQFLEKHPHVRLVGPREPDQRLPTAAFCVRNRKSGDVASALRAQGVVVGSGLQCAPLAHETLGTAPDGVVRLSAGPGFGEEEVARALTALEQTLGTSAGCL